LTYLELHFNLSTKVCSIMALRKERSAH